MKELPSTFKLATIWLIIGTVLFLAFQALERQERASQFSVRQGPGEQVIELKRARDGHYHWPGTVNGVAVDFLVDTGATSTAIPRALAEQAGLSIDGQTSSSTAGGVVSAGLARAEVSLAGGVQVKNLRVIVLDRLEDQPLLGMDVLGKLRLAQQDNVLTLRATR
jgi:aspartyl protease family protein